MCGRYRLKRADARELALLLGIPELEIRLADPDQPRFNIAPQEKTPPPIIYRPARDAPPQVTQSLPWGITLPDRLLINAKAESANIHAANLTARRCLVPAHGYYEWFALASPPGTLPSAKPRKVPHLLHLPGESLFHFAGLWGPNVKATAIGSNGFVIMTGEPGREIAWLHNRMPLVVPPEAYDQWLAPDLTYQQAKALVLDVIVPHSQRLPWEVKAITPLPSGRNAGIIPAPVTLP